MRHTALVCLLSLAAVTLLTVTAAAAVEKYEETFTKTEPLTADGKVHLSNVTGDIQIETWNRNEVKIYAVKRSTAASMEKAKENAAKMEINITRMDGRLDIETKYPSSRTVLKRFNVSVDYTLTVPVRASVTVNNVSGNIFAKGMTGLPKLTTVSGDIEASNLNNGGVFSTVSGNIDLSVIKGDIETSNISGSVTLSSLAGSVKAETVSGNVIAKRMSAAKSVNISVHSGEIVFDGDINPEGRYTFETHSGPVTVTLPRDAAFDFECETFSGEIRSDFKAEIQSGGRSRHHEQDIRGTVNGGGAEVTITTFSGPIELLKKSEK